MKVFETKHWSRQPLDASVVLFNDIVQVFAMTNCDACVMVSIHLFQARLIGPALINVTRLGLPL